MKYIILLAGLLLLFSCNKNLGSLEKISAMSAKYGNYANYFYGENIGTIGFKATKIANLPIESAKFEAGILINNVSNLENTTISIGAVNLGYVTTNDDGWLARGFCIENTVDNINRPECKGAINQISPYFGSTHEFKIEENGANILTHSMYVPKKIEVENFASTPPDLGGSTYLVDRNNLTLSWNSDPNNTNGVFIVFMNTELSALKDQGVQLEVLLLNDTGSATIPSSTFHYIPQGGLCEMRVYRGDINLITGTNGLEYKVSAISSHEVQLKVD